MKKSIDLGGIIAGAVAIILGIASIAGAFTSKLFDGFSNHLLSYSFGADFYTEMYKASYEVNESLANVANTVASGANAVSGAVSTGCGIIAIDIGLLMIFRFASSYAEELALEKQAKAAAAESSAEEAASAEEAEPETSPIDETAADKLAENVEEASQEAADAVEAEAPASQQTIIAAPGAEVPAQPVDESELPRI